MSHQHTEHRKRHKNRFLSTSGKSFADHELLELLLFYAVPRKNTNDLAHKLCERFGTIDKVLEADVEELKQIEGIGHHSATMIKTVLCVALKYIEEKSKEPKQINTLCKALDYGRNRFFGSIKEVVYATFTDNQLNVIDTSLVCVGEIDEAKPLVRSILELSIIKRANAVVLFHNHPCGGTLASQADIDFTSLLERELHMIGIHLVEHLVVDTNGFNTVLKKIRAIDDIYDHIDLDSFYEEENTDDRKEEEK